MSHDWASNPWRTGACWFTLACVGVHNDMRDSMKGTLVSVIRKEPPEIFFWRCVSEGAPHPVEFLVGQGQRKKLRKKFSCDTLGAHHIHNCTCWATCWRSGEEVLLFFPLQAAFQPIVISHVITDSINCGDLPRGLLTQLGRRLPMPFLAMNFLSYFYFYFY
jgi:hypothetical protein